MAERDLLRASSLLAAATALGAVVSARHDLPGEPLGLRTPGRVRIQLALGLGSALSAPWPMPVLALVASLTAERHAATAGRRCLLVGSSVVAGTLVEPVTWGGRASSPAVRATVGLNLLAGSALALAGRRHLSR